MGALRTTVAANVPLQGRRRAAAAALVVLLAGCDSHAWTERRRLAALERDPVPPLYQAALTVRSADGSTVYSERGYRRIDTTSSSGHSYSIADPVRGLVFYWIDFGPSKNVVETRSMAPETRAILVRWHDRAKAQRVAPCEAAGETGSLYRFTYGSGLEGRLGRIEACISDDGVVLREAMLSGDLSRSRVVRNAVSVRRGPLPSRTFEPPAVR